MLKEEIMTDNIIDMYENDKEQKAITAARGIVTGNLVISILISLVALFVMIVCVIAFFGMQGDSGAFANLYYKLTDDEQGTCFCSSAAT